MVSVTEGRVFEFFQTRVLTLKFTNCLIIFLVCLFVCLCVCLFVCCIHVWHPVVGRLKCAEIHDTSVCVWVCVSVCVDYSNFVSDGGIIFDRNCLNGWRPFWILMSQWRSARVIYESALDLIAIIRVKFSLVNGCAHVERQLKYKTYST